MTLLHLGMALLAANNVVVPSHITTGSVIRRVHTPATATVYTSAQAEHYLTAQQIAYIRPGLNISVGSVTIGADNKPVVDVTFTDDGGQPLDRAGVLTPGPLSLSFILAWFDPAGRYYTDYYTSTASSTVTHLTVQQATTAAGTWEDIAVGHARFHFTKALPTGYDVTKTHTLGIYATRVINLTDPIVISKTYVANVEYDFRPDGQAVTNTWNKMTDATCNQCHDPLSAHGSTGRQDIKLCVLCHNPQTIDPDTGNSVDAKVLFHKLHMGSSLPSVEAGHPYQIIGHGGSVVDFSTIVFPQDIRNCTTCHQPSSPQGFVWYSYPSMAACGSCHDTIDWATGANHKGGPQADDSACAACHQPQGVNEFDAGIVTAHVIPTKSAQLKGLKIQVFSVTNAAPGTKPVVTFAVTNGDGSFVDPSSLGSFSFYLGGPTTDYASFLTERVGKNAVSKGTTSTFTFPDAIPATATGTWTLSADLYRTVTLNPAPETPSEATVREAAQNPIYNVAITDAQPVARRTVVDLAKCNVCHNQLALHGGQRFQVQECVICHNPNNTDAAYRPAAQAPNETIHFKYMIHRIHTGVDMTLPYTIYGYGGSINSFNDVLFPGDRRDCLKCHATVPAGQQQTFEVPLPDGVLPTPTLRNPYIQLMQPTAAACLSCHDAKDAAAHAVTMTATFGEACEVCHGTDADFAVAKVHAR